MDTFLGNINEQNWSQRGRKLKQNTDQRRNREGNPRSPGGKCISGCFQDTENSNVFKLI